MGKGIVIRPQSTAYTANNRGAINRKVNSSGSVTLPRKAVSTTVRIMPLATVLFFEYAQ
ncbi:hypothetical protein D3C86_1872560 [compost metagenome]